MGKSNVEEFASELGLPINLLLEQLKSSGVDKSSASDELKEEDKSALLAYLRSEHGASLRPKSKITLTRKQNTQIEKQIVKEEQEQFRLKLEKKELLLNLINPKRKILKALTENKLIKPTEIVDDNQKNIRDQEAKRHAALADAQAEDIQKKKDRQKRKMKHLKRELYIDQHQK